MTSFLALHAGSVTTIKGHKTIRELPKEGKKDGERVSREDT